MSTLTKFEINLKMHNVNIELTRPCASLQATMFSVNVMQDFCKYIEQLKLFFISLFKNILHYRESFNEPVQLP